MEKLKPHRIPSNLAAVTAAFDSYAVTYDASFDSSAITQRLRRKIYSIVEELVPRSGSILDINCGTGTDACYFASRGYKVTGIDISPKMIKQAKAKGAGMKNVRFRTASFQSSSPTVEGKYDLILSNFGGLNCVQRLEPVARQIASGTRQGVYFIGVFMPPHCLWEIVAGLGRFNFRSAFRRFKKRVFATGFEGHTFQVFYHSPFSVSRQLDRWFRVEYIQSFNIFSPPPHAMHFQRSNPHLSAFLQRVDDLVGSFPVFRSIGDHALIVARRR